VTKPNYILEDQIGFIMRLANQRHTGIFADLMGDDITPTQFATLAKLRELESCTQNKLGRYTAMDGATIKGVVGRLSKRGLVETRTDPSDSRRLLVELTNAGKELIEKAIIRGHKITADTLKPLSTKEQVQLVNLLQKIT